MKNSFLLFLSIIFFFVNKEVNAQSTSTNVRGKVEYRYFQDNERLNTTLEKMKQEEPDKWAMFGDHFKQISQIRGQFKYKLVFNQTASHFSLVQEANEDYEGLAYKTAMNVGKGNKVQYLDLNEKKRIEQMKMRDNSIIHSVQPFDKYKWELTGNVKKIGKYVCREAIGTFMVYSKAGQVTKEAVAWFTPELPFSFGPMGFDGLPGLILEVYPAKGFNHAYRAVNIDVILNASDSRLPKLKKPSEVLEEEELQNRFGMMVKEIKGKN